jgi:hypothetical protein
MPKQQSTSFWSQGILGIKFWSKIEVVMEDFEWHVSGNSQPGGWQGIYF